MFSGIVSLAVAAEIGKSQLALQKAADKVYFTGASMVVTYDVSTRGTVKGDAEEFRRIVAETFADERGWRRAGVTFKEVPSGGRLHMVLAEPSQVKAAAPGGCSDTLSCTVKPYVLINDVRWMNASDSYNELGVSLLDYRRMVINHEVGHFLGHEHIARCETAGGLGPIMIQQSTGLRNCRPNSWPLPNELWVRGVK